MPLVSQLKGLFKGQSLHSHTPTTSVPTPASSAMPTTATRDRITEPQILTPATTTTQATKTVVQSSKEQAEAIVRRENEQRTAREAAPYAGLPQGLTLGIKMGDGAFSNVFQATLVPSPAQLAIDPSLGPSVKVAVKCVRKYELSHSQVGFTLSSRSGAAVWDLMGSVRVYEGRCGAGGAAGGTEC